MSLEKRKAIKKKKPDYRQQDSHKLGRLSDSWRKPRGSDSKIRLNMKGYSKKVQVGYGSPRSTYGLSPEGLKQVIISNVSELKALSKDAGAIISSKVGNKKRITIIEEALKASVKILNIKDPAKFLEDLKKDMKSRKDVRDAKLKKKDQKKAKPKKKDEKLADKVLTEEEQAVQEKKDKDKILTTKEL